MLSALLLMGQPGTLSASPMGAGKAVSAMSTIKRVTEAASALAVSAQVDYCKRCSHGGKRPQAACHHENTFMKCRVERLRHGPALRPPSGRVHDCSVALPKACAGFSWLYWLEDDFRLVASFPNHSR